MSLSWAGSASSCSSPRSADLLRTRTRGRHDGGRRRSWLAQILEFENTRLAQSIREVETSEALLEAEWGARRSEIMRIEPRPLGSASLAQVHRATLHSGRDVVLKLQRPGLEKLFRLDLQVMEQVAAVLQRHPNWGRGRDWVAMARECRRVLLRELDFRLEAEHAARFRQQFLDDPDVRIPAVIWELTTRRVLCLDYVPGTKITDREALLQRGLKAESEVREDAVAAMRRLNSLRLWTPGGSHWDPEGPMAAALELGLQGSSPAF